MTQKEALKALEQNENEFVFAKDIAPVIGVRPERLVWRAKHPGDSPLPFRFVILGDEKETVKFVKRSFLKFVKGR